MAKRTISVDMNRVEGDLQVKLEIEDGVVTDAWTVGTMFRGFEQLLLGRAKMDGLVITPRICGICGTSHLYAAVTALETAMGCPIAPNGTRVRNLCLLAEEVQSDARHAFLMFTIDFCGARYRGHPEHAKILEAFAPFTGRIYRETIVETKKLLEIVALFGGQWPHSSYMVPGGVVGTPNRRALVKTLTIVDAYTRWYERSILGCSVERWLEVKSPEDLDRWLEERAEHREGALGRFVRFARDVGLERLGRGTGNMLSYGSFFDPVLWQPPFGERHCLRAPGFYEAAVGHVTPFAHTDVSEHVTHSWYRDAPASHPWKGETVPTYEPEGEKYTWAKAPRFRGKVVEVGCFPELFMAGDPLIRSLFASSGINVFTRQLARLHRPVLSLLLLRRTLQELERDFAEPFYTVPKQVEDGDGAGLIHAARGALGHWLQIRDGKIARYQVITPTGWNASPRDSTGQRGHWEQSLIGTPIPDEDDPVELGHVIRSHDACLVCTVHSLRTGRTLRLGA
jgi:hydrogenase large subunit